MADIRAMLEREVHSVQPSERWMTHTLRKVGRRQRARRILTAWVSLAVALAGFLVALRAFTGAAPNRPASQADPNYQLSARMLEPGAPVPDAAGLRGEDLVWIGVDVRWNPAENPGVHQCTWEVLDKDGSVVSSRTQLFLPRVPISRGEASFVSKMLDLTGEPVRARAGCGVERLDTPGISELQPPPETSDWDATLAELDARLESWAERFRIREMSPEYLAGNMWALRHAMIALALGERDHLQLRELSMRLRALCVLLPSAHEFRGGEFCD